MFKILIGSPTVDTHSDLLCPVVKKQTKSWVDYQASWWVRATVRHTCPSAALWLEQVDITDTRYLVFVDFPCKDLNFHSQNHTISGECWHCREGERGSMNLYNSGNKSLPPFLYRIPSVLPISSPLLFVVYLIDLIKMCLKHLRLICEPFISWLLGQLAG